MLEEEAERLRPAIASTIVMMTLVAVMLATVLMETTFLFLGDHKRTRFTLQVTGVGKAVQLWVTLHVIVGFLSFLFGQTVPA